MVISTTNTETLSDITTKYDFIKELSKRTGYTQNDSKKFLDCFISIFEDATRDLAEIDIQEFGKLRHSLILSHKGSKPKRGIKGEYEEIDIPDCTRTTFVLSKKLKNKSKIDLTINEEE